MKCPQCQTENRGAAKFCNECGAKLEVPCPKCGNHNRPGSKFCDECGHNLSFLQEKSSQTSLLDEKIKKIQKYLPKGLTEKILSLKDRIEGERKHVTVMFCDLQGYTTLPSVPMKVRHLPLEKLV